MSFCLLFAVLLTNCADVASCQFGRRTGDSFDLTGQVLITDNGGDPILRLTDKTGSTQVMGVRHVTNALPFASGDIIRATGVIDVAFDSRTKLPSVICRSVRFVAKGELPRPVRASYSEIQSGRLDGRRVRIEGRIRRVFRDEVDINWIYAALDTGDGLLYLTTRGNPDLEKRIRNLTGADIEVNGVCDASFVMLRQLFGKTIGFNGMSDISLLKSPPDPFSVPLLNDRKAFDVASINRLGLHRLVGTVLAIDSNRRALVKSDRGDIHDVHLMDAPVPKCGQRIEAVGIPEADFYQVNLVDSIWRPADGRPPEELAAEDVTFGRLLTDGRGHAQINPYFHGRLVRLCGTLIDVPTVASGRTTAILKGDTGTVLLDLSAAQKALGSITVGCTVRVTGICSVNRDATDPVQGFQRVTGVTLVLRTDEDLKILSRPPWWTPFRLTLALALLFLSLVGFFIWNRILQRIVDRKSRQLLKEQVAQIKTALRVDERTNLAVELHDSLSQNLSGVACQIAATKGTLPEGANETARYLATAERMLLSCRTELRRCLWDLRGDTLEEADFTEAIRKTLAPVVIGTETIIRFNVPRNRLSDTTAHAVLCIIRELTANAIRHGKAGILRIAGEFHDGRLSFSVRDNGLGFDPLRCDGPAEGHFGLQGIRERIKRLNGTFTLTAEPGKGTRAEVSIMSIPSQCDDTNS